MIIFIIILLFSYCIKNKLMIMFKLLNVDIGSIKLKDILQNLNTNAISDANTVFDSNTNIVSNITRDTVSDTNTDNVCDSNKDTISDKNKDNVSDSNKDTVSDTNKDDVSDINKITSNTDKFTIDKLNALIDNDDNYDHSALYCKMTNSSKLMKYEINKPPEFNKHIIHCLACEVDDKHNLNELNCDGCQQLTTNIKYCDLCCFKYRKCKVCLSDWKLPKQSFIEFKQSIIKELNQTLNKASEVQSEFLIYTAKDIIELAKKHFDNDYSVNYLPMLTYFFYTERGL